MGELGIEEGKAKGNEIDRNGILVGDEINIDGATAPGRVERIEKAGKRRRQVTGKLGSIKGISLKIKLQIAQALMDSVLLYDTDTSDMSEYDLRLMQSEHERTISGIIRRERKEILYRRIEEIRKEWEEKKKVM